MERTQKIRGITYRTWWNSYFYPLNYLGTREVTDLTILDKIVRILPWNIVYPSRALTTRLIIPASLL